MPPKFDAPVRARAATGLLIAILANALVTSVGHAQDARVCAVRLESPTPDSVRSTFAATVQSFNPRRPVPTIWAGMLGEGVHQRLTLPPGLIFPVFEPDSIAPAASPAVKTLMAVPSMYAVFGVTVEAGKFTRIRRIAGASSDAFDLAVTRALVVLDSSSELPPLPQELGPDPLEISLAISRMPQREVHPVMSNPDVPVMPLFIVRSPARAVDKPITRGADFSRFVPQPPTKREDEAVMVRIVVTPDGFVDPGSMQVLAFSSTGYIKSVFDMIPNWQFKPLVLAGCAVPAIEELTFTAAPGASSRR